MGTATTTVTTAMTKKMTMVMTTSWTSPGKPVKLQQTPTGPELTTPSNAPIPKAMIARSSKKPSSSHTAMNMETKKMTMSMATSMTMTSKIGRTSATSMTMTSMPTTWTIKESEYDLLYECSRAPDPNTRIDSFC